MSKQGYVDIPLPKKLFQELEELAKNQGKTTNELALEAVRERLMRADLVKVTIKVPRLLLKLLEDQNYFGWTREDFHIEAVKSGIGIATSNMDIDKADMLYKKYGEKIDVVHLPDGFKTYAVSL